MDRKSNEKLLQLLEEKHRREKYNKFRYFFPDKDNLNFSGLASGVIYNRESYSKHVNFFNAGAKHPERIFMAGNRCGKTLSGSFELTCHLTGIYPDWWIGRKFTRPIRAWACGKIKTTTRDIVQNELLGPRTDIGSGMVPKDLIVRTTTAPGVPDGIETVSVKHVTGGESVLTFKSYDSGVESFVGTAMDVIWLDEECPPNIYTECVVRTATTNGIVFITFTPDRGLSDTVLLFFENGKVNEGSQGNKFVSMCSWDDVPHLSTETKRQLWDSIPPHQRDAKTKGIPFLGSGAIYPVFEDDIKVKSFKIPVEWPRAYGLDVGWNRTAAVFGAYNEKEDVWYIYSEYYRGQAEPSVHASAIKSRGPWMNGVIDKAARGRSQIDGEKLIDVYTDLGLNLIPSIQSKVVESGIQSTLERLSTGRLKVFDICQNWFTEFRIYRRDEKGKIIKKDDHLMDATRYLVDSGFDIATIEPDYDDSQYDFDYAGRDRISGY